MGLFSKKIQVFKLLDTFNSPFEGNVGYEKGIVNHKIDDTIVVIDQDVWVKNPIIDQYVISTYDATFVDLNPKIFEKII
jgi:uncharacterized protein YgbK (DUF1537 family)